jgi:hypothetical protein
LVAVAEASPPYLARDWHRQCLGGLRQDGTLTRLATQGEAGILAHAVHLMEFLEGRPVGAGSIALPALAAQISGSTKVLNHGTGWAHSCCGPSRSGLASRVPGTQPSGETCGTAPVSWSMIWPAGSWVLNLPAEGEGLGEWLAGAAR